MLILCSYKLLFKYKLPLLILKNLISSRRTKKKPKKIASKDVKVKSNFDKIYEETILGKKIENINKKVTINEGKNWCLSNSTICIN